MQYTSNTYTPTAHIDTHTRCDRLRRSRALRDKTICAAAALGKVDYYNIITLTQTYTLTHTHTYTAAAPSRSAALSASVAGARQRRPAAR